MSPHSPGPWKAVQFDRWPHDGGKEWTIETQDGAGVLAVDNSGDNLCINTEANARLIAAAPQMLDLLRALATDDNDGGESGYWCQENNGPGGHNDDCVHQRTRALIAEIEGKGGDAGG